MGTFLFDDIIFGPVNSRRLGISLGINLLPKESKLCNYNCIYCECGLSKVENYNRIPSYTEIVSAMEENFRFLRENKLNIDAITFAGNGEPSLHPDFSKIVEKTIELRDIYLKGVDIIVLTNATLILNRDIAKALNMVDKAILKIDTVNEEDFLKINCPKENVEISDIILGIKKNINKIYIQTMFFRSTHAGYCFDNTTDQSLIAYLEMLDYLKPQQVMIYSIARDTPLAGLQKVSAEELERIGDSIRRRGINVLITP